eukprot:3749831-Rhodomonas_salina.1
MRDTIQSKSQRDLRSSVLAPPTPPQPMHAPAFSTPPPHHQTPLHGGSYCSNGQLDSFAARAPVVRRDPSYALPTRFVLTRAMLLQEPLPRPWNLPPGRLILLVACVRTGQCGAYTSTGQCIAT